MFTFPWTATNEFPHPFTRVKQPAAYRLSYQIIDTFVWLGTGDQINEYRKKRLKLRPVTYLRGSHNSRMELPFCYIWSPHLVPKPKDWGPKIDIADFCFLDLATNYEPPTALKDWLRNGDAPIYIGFGSLPVQEPEKMTEVIIKALELTGQRGILNKGWGGLGNSAKPKKNVYLLDSPSWRSWNNSCWSQGCMYATIVPFFGDQLFCGEQIHARGVGPSPISIINFSTEKLVCTIKYMLDPRVKQRAVDLAKAMEKEDGVTGAVKVFYKHFPIKKIESAPVRSRRFTDEEFVSSVNVYMVEIGHFLYMAYEKACHISFPFSWLLVLVDRKFSLFEIIFSHHFIVVIVMRTYTSMNYIA